MIANHSDIRRTTEPGASIFDAMVSAYYDWVIEYNTENDEIEFLHISDNFLYLGIIPEKLTYFDELNKLFSKELVIQEEKEPYLDQVSLPHILSETNDNGTFVRTIHINTPDGIKAESLRITPLSDDCKRFLVCLADISMILDHDWMTDRYSRSGFISRLEHLLKETQYQEGYSVLYTNIQGFKAINDILGTHSGDLIILKTCSVIENELNPVVLARLENDHFAAFVRTDSITEEKMASLCNQSFVDGSKRLSYVMRCGIYNINDHTKQISYMIDQAKLAEISIPMDQVIPYAICSEQMRQDYVNQRRFVSDLDSALSKGEFLPYFQPIVDAKTYEIVGAEALIRWNHSEKGLIPPGLFIPVFEKEGLTSKLASFMINCILDFNDSRIQQGKKSIPCSVNLSRVDFFDTKLIDFMKEKLTNKENISNILKLEITESSYVALESDALPFLDEMRKLNLSILLDDFGNGMSSLSTLEVYNFDVIKLDMGFIRRIGKNPKTEAIIRHTIGMAHALGAKVVAEGVEYKEQLEFLQSVDCDMIQGYYFYKPMPAEEFIKLI